MSDKTVYISVEIDESVLRRLFRDNNLVAEELRCFSRQSKRIVRKAILDSQKSVQ